jgi:hypothetical protein
MRAAARVSGNSTRYFRLLFVLSMIAMAAPVFSQTGEYRPPTGPTPRTTDGKPDLSGVWDPPYVPDMTKTGKNQKGPGDLPFTEWGASEWKNYHAEEGDYTGACLPTGFVRGINSPMPLQIVQSPKYVTFLFEWDNWFHIVPVDGRGHRNQDPTWAGDSIGRWDGDTLVVDTVNLNGKTKLDTVGHPLSDQLHVIQRLTRTDLGHIAYEITIDDPKTYTKPWKSSRTFTLRPDWEIMEYSCMENNKSLYEGRIKPPKF